MSLKKCRILIRYFFCPFGRNTDTFFIFKGSYSRFGRGMPFIDAKPVLKTDNKLFIV